MGVSMVFNVVDAGLPDVALVTREEPLPYQREREKQALAQRRCVAHPHGAQVMVVVSA